MKQFKADIKRILDRLDSTNGISVSASGPFSMTTSKSLVVTLYNSGLRPTKYEIRFRYCKYGNLSGFALDTIIRENKSHESIKDQFPSEDYLVKTINRLASQEHDGTKEETLKNFTPMGMLYMVK